VDSYQKPKAALITTSAATGEGFYSLLLLSECMGEREIGMCAEKRDTSICVSFMLWGMGLMTETIAIKP